MSAAGGREKRGLTLLVQLFGREVLDQLARNGFDSAAAIAASGPDRLAAATGIPLSLAQRIAVVAQETRGPAPVTRKEPGDEEPRPRRRPVPRGPVAPVESSHASEKAAESEPVVDDVALVSWMGFSSKAHGGRRTFSVADSILDPVPPETPPDSESVPSSRSPASRGTSAPAGTAPPEVARRRPSRSSLTLTGSFWSFGRREDGARPCPGGQSDPQSPTDVPPRRDHHDH